MARIRGTLRSAAKRVYEEILWGRVWLAGTIDRVLSRERPLPASVPPTAVLGRSEQVEAAIQEAKTLGLPLHPDRPKNWDSIGAVGVVLRRFGHQARVLDVGAARYSVPLPWLRIFGLSDLLGINLEFGRPTRHGPVLFRHGDAIATGVPDASIDAVLCMSVIEHGVPIEDFLAESARILRQGGLLCVSTDYDQEPPPTDGLIAYDVPVRIFGPADVRHLIDEAQGLGLHLVGELQLEHEERPVEWKRFGLRYTFILLTFERNETNRPAGDPSAR